jgi:hypothetical protein
LAGSIICLLPAPVDKQRWRPIAPGEAAEFGENTNRQTGCEHGPSGDKVLLPYPLLFFIATPR